MSWKGFTKGVTRAPQTIKSKFNIGDTTKDPIYQDAERRFQELELETKKLHDESKKYFDAINGMLNHQIEFSKACAEIYKPISGRMSDPDSYVAEGNPEGIRACEEYESIVRELQVTLAPELEIIEARVIKPADELLEIIKQIRKTAMKRDHKQLDFDRHRTTLKKLQEKKEKTLKDEKAIYKAENDAELATQEFNYFNDLLKDQLPQLFRLEREFIKPLFQSFYYMQLNVFYTLHERMQRIDIGYFDLTLDIEAAFEKKRGAIQQQAEALTIVHYKTTGGVRRLPKYGSKLAIEDKQNGASSSSSAAGGATIESPPPPPYSPAGGAGSIRTSSPAATSHAGSPIVGSATGSASAANVWGTVAKAKGPAPPPPKPKPARFSVATPAAPAAETVTALFDYEAQAEGDLSFSAGDVIEIVRRTGNSNEWWTGKVDGRQGQFPGNYVSLDT